MTPVLTTERIRPPYRSRLPSRLAALVVAAAAVAVALTFVTRLEGPAFVDELTVSNPTVYRFNIDVSGPDDAAVIELGTLGRGDEIRFQAIIDQGEVWVFHFDYGGFDGGWITVGRDELEANGWNLEIPRAAELRLQELGVTPSAEFF